MSNREIVVNVKRKSLEACMTCPLCKLVLEEATALSLCLHTFCRKCIYEKLSDEELHYCPVCHIDLGRLPLEKLRADHNLRDIRIRIFPLKKRRIDAPDFTPSVSFPVEEEEEEVEVVRAPSASLPPNEPTQIPSEDPKSYNRADQSVHDHICDAIKSAISEVVAHISRMAGEALMNSPVFSQNLGVLKALSSNSFPDCSNHKEVFESMPRVLDSAVNALYSIRSGIPLLDAQVVQNNFLSYCIDSVIGGLQVYFTIFRTMSLFHQEEQLLSKAFKQLEEKDVLVASLRQKEVELRSIAEHALIKQAQAEAALRDMQIKEKTVVEDARREIRESLAKQFQDVLSKV